MIDFDLLTTLAGDVNVALNFLYNMSDIVEEPYFNTRDYNVTIERLEACQGELYAERDLRIEEAKQILGV